MRALVLIVAVAACTPDIASGAYVCGAEQACPEGQACNGSDNTCVVASSATPFACDPLDLHEPDDTIAQAFAMPKLDCVSTPFVGNGCLAADDAHNFFALSVPATCAAVEIDARITFPIAFEAVDFELWDATANTMIAPTTACGPNAGLGSGEHDRCLKMTVTPGGSYAIDVVPTGEGDCGGTCNYNRYQLTVQLETPG